MDHEENKEKSKKVMRVQYICMMMIIHVIMCKWMRELSEKVNLTNTRLVQHSTYDYVLSAILICYRTPGYTMFMACMPRLWVSVHTLCSRMLDMPS